MTKIDYLPFQILLKILELFNLIISKISSDGGNFPHIIEIALFLYISKTDMICLFFWWINMCLCFIFKCLISISHFRYLLKGKKNLKMENQSNLDNFCVSLPKVVIFYKILFLTFKACVFVYLCVTVFINMRFNF